MKKIILSAIGIGSILLFTGCGARQPFVYNATSNVPSTQVYCGTTHTNLKHCYTTPFHKTSYSSLVWTYKYFQAKKDGYIDSKIKRAYVSGYRGTIHFNLLKDNSKQILEEKIIKKQKQTINSQKQIINNLIEKNDLKGLKKYTDNNPNSVYYIKDSKIRLILTGPKGMKVGDIKKLITKGRSETIIIALIQRVKVPYKEFTLDEIDILTDMKLSDNIIATMINVTTELLKNEEKKKQQQFYLKEQNKISKQKTKVIYKNTNNTQPVNNNNAIGDKLQDEVIKQGVGMLLDQLF